jgi:hypothetical protein
VRWPFARPRSPEEEAEEKRAFEARIAELV